MPSYGNLTVGSKNETHVGSRDFWFFKDINQFTVNIFFILNTFLILFSQVTNEVRSIVDGKTIFKSLYNPCNKLSSKNMKRIMTMYTDQTSLTLEDAIPATWYCPIKKVRELKT